MQDDQRRELLSLIARADQLVADADAYLFDPGEIDNWVLAEDLREMLVEMRARMEARIERDAAGGCV